MPPEAEPSSVSVADGDDGLRGVLVLVRTTIICSFENFADRGHTGRPRGNASLGVQKFEPRSTRPSPQQRRGPYLGSDDRACGGVDGHDFPGRRKLSRARATRRRPGTRVHPRFTAASVPCEPHRLDLPCKVGTQSLRLRRRLQDESHPKPKVSSSRRRARDDWRPRRNSRSMLRAEHDPLQRGR